MHPVNSNHQTDLVACVCIPDDDDDGDDDSEFSICYAAAIGKVSSRESKRRSRCERILNGNRERSVSGQLERVLYRKPIGPCGLTSEMAHAALDTQLCAYCGRQERVRLQGNYR